MLLVLALQLLGQGVLLAALRELDATRASVARLQARGAMEAGVRVTLGAAGWASGDRTPGQRYPVLQGTAGEAEFSITALRLGRESWLVEGMGSSAVGRRGGTGSVRAAAGRLVWLLEPLARVGRAGAVVTTAAGAPVSGVPTGSRYVMHDEPGDALDCGPWQTALDSVLPSGRLPALGPLAADGPGLGLLPLDTLVARGYAVSSGAVAPQPAVTDGVCDMDAPDNWGDPRLADGVCAQHMVFQSHPGDLVLHGGLGQGLLAVGGDLTLTGATEFRGVVLVGGRLRVAQASRLEGLVQAAGGVDVDATASVVGSACWALGALTAAEEALRTAVPVRLGWLPEG